VTPTFNENWSSFSCQGLLGRNWSSVLTRGRERNFPRPCLLHRGKRGCNTSYTYSHRQPLAMLRLLPRAIHRPGRLKCSLRGFHDDTATLVNLGANGQLVTTQHPITIGDPHEAYVIIPVEVGRVFQAVAATHQSPDFGVRNSEIKRPLWFFHETKHFAHGIEGLCSL
jgi:hypothetical protein